MTNEKDLDDLPPGGNPDRSASEACTDGRKGEERLQDVYIGERKAEELEGHAAECDYCRRRLAWFSRLVERLRSEAGNPWED